jgi:site-specific recombinase XerD
MNKFETYLTDNGIHIKVARRYVKVSVKYTDWLKANNLSVEKVKRSDFTDWLQTYREQGFKQCTLDYKENVIRYYYYFLGTKSNPALTWIIRKDEWKLPPPLIEKNDLMKI